MAKRKTALTIRKIHRYLGIFLGIQFLMWTISGLYFSWTDIDEIHGDHFRRELKPTMHNNLMSLDSILPETPVFSMELRTVSNTPYYWINDSLLVNASNGTIKPQISKEEALQVANTHMLETLKVKSVDLITSAGKHHEYRERPLPAYVISYKHPENIKAYVSARDGSFQRVRHRSWRWFDFLWMTHTMDYQGRDNFNATILRAFSLLGLITVLSGFLLWYVSSPTWKKLINSIKKKQK